MNSLHCKIYIKNITFWVLNLCGWVGVRKFRTTCNSVFIQITSSIGRLKLCVQICRMVKPQWWTKLCNLSLFLLPQFKIKLTTFNRFDRWWYTGFYYTRLAWSHGWLRGGRRRWCQGSRREGGEQGRGRAGRRLEAEAGSTIPTWESDQDLMFVQHFTSPSRPTYRCRSRQWWRFLRWEHGGHWGFENYLQVWKRAEDIIRFANLTNSPSLWNISETLMFLSV